MVKIYAGATATKRYEKRYSPAECTGIKQSLVECNPDEAHISTSKIERQNLTMRVHMRRFTRLTNGLSTKVENHMHAVARHGMYCNLVKVHQTLKGAPAGKPI